MRKISLILSIDYELFGDGSGNVIREQVIPTNNLMDVCELNDAKITCFIEMGQFFFYQDHSNKFPELQESNELILNQIKDLIRRGHDVQFHYHPTWFNATISSSGKIELDLELYDISQLKIADQIQILKRGKTFLENELKEINPTYSCIAFRAGALTVGDQKSFSKILRDTGYKIETSVTLHAHSDAIYGNFDYRQFPQGNPFWYFSDNFQQLDNQGALLQIPILGEKAFLAARKYKNFKYSRSRTISNKFYKTRISERNLNVVGKFMRIINRDYYFADFNNLQAETLLKMISTHVDNCDDSFNNIPIMLIGHSKSCYFNDDLHILFSNLAELEYDVSYETISTFYHKIQKPVI